MPVFVVPFHALEHREGKFAAWEISPLHTLKWLKTQKLNNHRLQGLERGLSAKALKIRCPCFLSNEDESFAIQNGGSSPSMPQMKTWHKAIRIENRQTEASNCASIKLGKRRGDKS